MEKVISQGSGGKMSSYPIKQHLLCGLPPLLIIVLLWVMVGSDSAMTPFFSAYRETHPGLTRFMQIITDWANIPLYILYTLLFLAAWRNKNASLRHFVLGAVAGFLAALALSEICKITVGRQRPLAGDGFMPFSFTKDYHSYPSGHTTRIVSSILPLAQRYGNVLLPLTLGCLAALVGFSRVYLSWHDPSDILGGFITGSIGGYVAWRVSCSFGCAENKNR